MLMFIPICSLLLICFNTKCFTDVLCLKSFKSRIQLFLWNMSWDGCFLVKICLLVLYEVHLHFKLKSSLRLQLLTAHSLHSKVNVMGQKFKWMKRNLNKWQMFCNTHTGILMVLLLRITIIITSSVFMFHPEKVHYLN